MTARDGRVGSIYDGLEENPAVNISPRRFSETTTNVIPAQAGIHRSMISVADAWVPAFAGMTS
jgi:hypothetical protein